MRIKDGDDLSRLGARARLQIENALAAASIPNKSNSKDEAGRRASDTPDSSKDKPPSRISKTNDGLNYCLVPNPDPGVKLHVAMEKEFGSWWDGGELVSEMILPGHEISFRFDLCLPRYKFAIEVDGFGFHRDLKSFKKDREKQKHALITGWVVYRVTVSEIRSEFDSIIPNIYRMLSHLRRGSALIEPVGKTWCSYLGPNT